MVHGHYKFMGLTPQADFNYTTPSYPNLTSINTAVKIAYPNNVPGGCPCKSQTTLAGGGGGGIKCISATT